MYRFITLFSAMIFLAFKTFGQQADKRTNVWYFGNNAGIDFNGAVPKGLRNGDLIQREGCASICDEKGNLLLYTNGIKIWNRKHKVISEGVELSGDDTSTQSAIIVPLPGNPNVYYIFTTYKKLSYVVVDITANQGNGAVVSEAVLLSNSTEKLAAVSHCNNRDFWVLAHENGNNMFRCYLLTGDGIAEAPVSSTSGTALNYFKSVGHMKFSSSGENLAMAIFGQSRFEIYHFDNSTGMVSGAVTLEDDDFRNAYGLEFSPNGKFLYVSETVSPDSRLFQLDITSRNSKKILRTKTEIGRTPGSYFGSIQAGPDQKIYVARQDSKYLGVINFPDKTGERCSYLNNGFELPAGSSAMGLPNFPKLFNKRERTIKINRDGQGNQAVLRAHTDFNMAGYVFEWYRNDQIIKGADQDTYKAERSGEYYVKLTGKCLPAPLTSEKVAVQIPDANRECTVLIPDIFTPNHDGINDSFRVIVTGGETVQLDIFDRWGNKIFAGSGPDVHWDGQQHGAACLSGIYTFILKYKNAEGHEQMRRGTIWLQR